MKGIILAGGRGSRLFPLTLAICKQLLPVYDKPMIYYPLSVLMMAGIQEILIISTPQDLPHFQRLFNDGSHLGLSLSYAEQSQPRGIAEALIIGASFIGSDSVALILGDNLFHSAHLAEILAPCAALERGALIFGYQVKDPERYGVLQFAGEQVVDIIEKPQVAPSPYAVPGLYFYDAQAPALASTLTPSARGELEITDLHRIYLKRGMLRVTLLDNGFSWLDAGTPEALHQASSYVRAIQQREGIKIGSIEEIAQERGLIPNIRNINPRPY